MRQADREPLKTQPGVLEANIRFLFIRISSQDLGSNCFKTSVLKDLSCKGKHQAFGRVSPEPIQTQPGFGTGPDYWIFTKLV
jgi:hypothetical protein